MIVYFIEQRIETKNLRFGWWKVVNKLVLQPSNCWNLVEICLQYLCSSDAEIHERIGQLVG
jgi:hypothetical protein